ncbi:A disintegrin and metalloproteinase with thrombospondin motifs like [Microplitis mediator]|uniref:A disintegrin and metalloproteinase with thrombospondin motifs like n=1 Tax=Microplitis mediator TaxID=375433 RepID=UPI00255587D7|nr:A disintegrin and metalloproteinase with thrombospondin motifs like [Microplitis mediator]
MRSVTERFFRIKWFLANYQGLGRELLLESEMSSEVIDLVLFRVPLYRDLNGLLLSVKPFGQHIKMWLNPADGILAGENLPIYRFKTDPNNRRLMDIRTDTELIKSLLPQLYENTLYASTIAVNNHPDGGQSMKGFIGDKYIQPVPSRLMEHAKRHRKSINDTPDHESDNKIYHFVHKIPQTKMHSPSLKKSYLPRVLIRPKKVYPAIIYPELLVIADYNFFARFRGIEDAILYLITFWNGVDMRYRSLENPKVRLNIAGILFAEDPYILSYIRVLNENFMGLTKILRAKGKWLYFMQKLIPINSYDIAVTMTPFTLCENLADCRILGQVAEIAGACHVDDGKKTMGRVAIIHDRGAFDGINTAAHELGHLFGMRHDGTVNQNCEARHGFMMAPSQEFTKYAFEWSQCSLIDMQNFLMSQRASCLNNKPNEGKPIYRYLPGRLMNANQQCRILNSGSAAVIDDSICTELKCSINNSRDPLPEAAEGTACGNGKMCLHGKCIFESQINL